MEVYTSEHTSIQDDGETYMNRRHENTGGYAPRISDAEDIQKLEPSPYAGPDERVPDARDLAKNGLPSACIFVAKLDF